MNFERVVRWSTVTAGLLLAASCSSKTPRDQYYGTDAGLVYRAPDGGAQADALQSDMSATDDRPGLDTADKDASSNDGDASAAAVDTHADAGSDGPDER